jgi:membrane-associated phospholipid phosphatase
MHFGESASARHSLENGNAAVCADRDVRTVTWKRPASGYAPAMPRETARPRWLRDAERLDVAVYAAIARTETPSLDRAMGALSRAADYSRLSVATAGLLAATCGRAGRRAAAYGLASVGVTATLVNLGMKPLGRRRRPDRTAQNVPVARHVRMPVSTSFPSGHAAAAFAFATGVGHVLPAASVPLRALAALVAYSRVHTGVHYPADVLGGALIGTALAQATAQILERR